MNRDPLDGALAKSLKDESAAVDNRFDQADRVLGEGQGTQRQARHAKSRPVKRASVVRDTFSFPDFDYALLSKLQAELLRNGHNVSKSELVRAGLKTLAAMKPAQLLQTAKAVERLKPGRSKVA